MFLLYAACALSVWSYFPLKIIDFLVKTLRLCDPQSQIRAQDCMLHNVVFGRVFSPLSKPLTLFTNKICHFPCRTGIFELIKNLILS